jgi:hypothetical protein
MYIDEEIASSLEQNNNNKKTEMITAANTNTVISTLSSAKVSSLSSLIESAKDAINATTNTKVVAVPLVQPLKNHDDISHLQEKRQPPIIKGCFIATAAMGSALHPHVQLLREFRDNILLQSRYKDTFENLLNKYYLLSPPIAKKMEQSYTLKVLLRYILVYPVVFGIKAILPIVDVILGIKKDAMARKRDKEQKSISILSRHQ